MLNMKIKTIWVFNLSFKFLGLGTHHWIRITKGGNILFFLPVSSKFNISSRESLSISIFNRSWLRIKNTVAVHKARPGFFGASFNSAKNWFIVPWALKCIRNEASIHLEAKSTVDKHLVLVFCLICNPSRIHSTLSSNSWDSPESWIWWACVKIIKKCKQRLIYLSIVKYN